MVVFWTPGPTSRRESTPGPEEAAEYEYEYEDLFPDVPSRTDQIYHGIDCCISLISLHKKGNFPSQITHSEVHRS